MHPNSPLSKDQNFVWREESILKAVELAERKPKNALLVPLTLRFLKKAMRILSPITIISEEGL